MADSTTSVALSIGSQRISMAVFENSKNGSLLMKAYDSEILTADPGMEAARAAQTRAAISQLAQRLNVGKSKVRYVVSGQAVFMRFVRLPPLQDDNIEQLVTFEAQQHVPFPLNEVVWDYELLEASATDERECVIVAIKADALDEIHAAVTDAGLSTVEVDVSPMAIYNAYIASHGKPEDTTLLIDIGAKTSNLIYMKDDLFFTRSIAIGGSTVTASLAKEYGISYGEAEEQKKINGLVALGGEHTEQLDESIAAMAMIIRDALSRLPAEIARTTNYYRSQHGGSAPKQIVIAGGGALLPYTLEFFREKLNLPVSFFNPIGQVALGKHVDAERIQAEAICMGDLVGLGVRGLGQSSVNIDLVPNVVEQERAEERRRPYLIAVAAVLILGFTSWAGMQHASANQAENQLRTMSETQEFLQPLHSKIEALGRNENLATQSAERYIQLDAEQTLWMDVLNELSGAFASDVMWIVDLEPLHGFDPFGEDKKAKGISVIRPNFPEIKDGLSSIANITVAAQEPQGQARPQTQATPQRPTVNAIRLTGYWRANPKSQNVVNDAVRSLRERSAMFRFTHDNGTENPQPLDDQVITPELQTEPQEEGDLAYRFQVVLPLAREIAIR